MKRIVLLVSVLLLLACSDNAPTAPLTQFGPQHAMGYQETVEMCKKGGWEALGFRNQGQCVRHARTGKGDMPAITDPDGNVYRTVEIGDQVWMVENLRTTRYADGTPIATGLSDSGWESASFGAYAIFPHNDVAGIQSDQEMLAAYGALYNWHAVDDARGLCPAGWRVPSDSDWQQLEIYLGTSPETANQTGWRGNEGGKLKSTRTEPDPHPRWDTPNVGASDYVGWAALPGGFRHPWGFYYDLGSEGFWWSSSAADVDTAWFRALWHGYSSMFRGSIFGKEAGFSVRCLRQ
jgi:uncharacterized protein (TIGR02145 family)